MSLTPNVAVEFVPEQVKQGHHRHVKKEEAPQPGSTEASKQGIHPDPRWHIHPYDPAEHVCRGTKKEKPALYLSDYQAHILPSDTDVKKML